MARRKKGCQATIANTHKRYESRPQDTSSKADNQRPVSVAEETGIDVNTVCRLVREYRRSHNLPSYAEEKGIHRRTPQAEGELMNRVKELEKALKKKEKDLQDENEKVEILKKIPAHLYATTRMKCEAIYVHSSEHSVRKMCKALGLCESSYRQLIKYTTINNANTRRPISIGYSYSELAFALCTLNRR